MTAVPATTRTGYKFMITVREGPDKGVAFQLLPPVVTIGRGPDNSVSLKDPRMSRSSAVIEFSPDVILIRDVSSRSNLMINGKPAPQASIRDGDVIRIGDTEMVFMVEAVALQAQPSLELHPPGLPPTVPPGFGSVRSGPTTHHPTPAALQTQTSKRLRFYGIVGIVLVAFLWLMTSSPHKKAKETALRSVEDIEKEIKGSEEFQQQIIKKRSFASDEERTRYEEAQRHYLEGFRDYQKGQWVRAMRSFETARAIDPEHELAQRYYKLSEKHRDEMVSLLMLEGRRYREKNMFSRCVAALEKVLDALPNRDDVKYKQAEALLKECQLMMDGRFR
jgi:hypothetical protein